MERTVGYVVVLLACLAYIGWVFGSEFGTKWGFAAVAIAWVMLPPVGK